MFMHDLREVFNSQTLAAVISLAKMVISLVVAGVASICLDRLLGFVRHWLDRPTRNDVQPDQSGDAGDVLPVLAVQDHDMSGSVPG